MQLNSILAVGNMILYTTTTMDKYLRQTLVFKSSRKLAEKFNFYFSQVF